MGARQYEDLTAWQLCRQFATGVAVVLRRHTPAEDYDLYEQMRSASRSPCRNIAEGFGRFFPKEFASFVRIARGSLSEMGEHLRDADAAGWLIDDEFTALMTLRDRASEQQPISTPISPGQPVPVLTRRPRTREPSDPKEPRTKEPRTREP